MVPAALGRSANRRLPESATAKGTSCKALKRMLSAMLTDVTFTVTCAFNRSHSTCQDQRTRGRAVLHVITEMGDLGSVWTHLVLQRADAWDLSHADVREIPLDQTPAHRTS